MPRKLTQQEWIDKARAVHGDKYDYSKVEYQKGTDRVTIICPEHGPFEQIASNHSYGVGCKACANDALPQKMSDNKESFVRKAVSVHGDRYDYSKVAYKHSGIEVEIICPTHGAFLQKPKNHIYGNKCPACGYAERDLLLSQEEYLASLPSAHRDAYDYSRAVYLGARNTIDIVCNACGDTFTQNANLHQQGAGCPSCALKNRAGRTFEVKELPSREEILEKYEYVRSDGTLRHRSGVTSVKQGQIAGTINADGYRALEYKGTVYLAHRVIAMLEGLDVRADTEVDHHNGVRDDNRISNLRVVGHVDNCKNQKLRKTNKVGYPNIKAIGDRFAAHIGHENENIHLGVFDTLEEAIAARKEAEAKLNYHPNHGKSAEARSEYLWEGTEKGPEGPSLSDVLVAD